MKARDPAPAVVGTQDDSDLASGTHIKVSHEPSNGKKKVLEDGSS